MSSRQSHDGQIEDFDLFPPESNDALAGDETFDFEPAGGPDVTAVPISVGADFVAFEPEPVGGNVALFGGAALALAGIGLAVWQRAAIASVPQAIEYLGITPFALGATGLLLIAFAAVLRTHADARNRAGEQLQPMLQALDTLANRPESSIAAGDEMQHVLVAMQRLDEKISNLSRATKMYGKPLLDIASSVEKTNEQLTQLETTFGTVSTKVGSLDDRIGSSATQLGAEIADLRDAIPRPQKSVAPEQFEQLVVAMRRSAKTIEDLQAELESKPDAGTPVQAMQHSVDALRGQVDKLIERLASVEHEVRAAGTAAATAAAASASAAAAAAARPLTAETPSAQTHATPQVAQPTPAATTNSEAQTAQSPAPTKSSGKTPPTPAGDGLAHSIAGERKAGGKNVLGAIAKLKQMRH